MQHDLLYPRPSFAKATEGRSKTRQTYYDFIKFGFVKVFCVFLFFFVFPGKVSAAALTSVSNVPWSSDISVTGKHTVKFTIVTAVPADGKIVINFPSGFTVSSATFDSWSGFDGGRSLSVSGQVVTITRDNTGTSSTAGAKYIVLAGITNNSSAASTYTATVETQDSSSSTLDGVTTSASFSTTATSDGLDTTAPWPMRGHDNRQSFLGTATAPDYPTLAWKFNFIDNDYHDGAVEDSNGIIYINGTTNVYALNTDGSTKWSVAQSRGTSAGTMLTTNSRLVIWYRNGFVESRSISDGSLVWSYASSIGTDAGSLSMGPDGTILIATNSTGMEGINSDGTRKFYNSATSSRDGTPAVDSTTGEIYTFDDGASAGHYPDGTFKWSATGAPGGSVGNPAQLNFSGSIVCGISRSTPNSGSACLNTSNGSNLWSVSTPGGLGISYTQGAWSPDSSIFYTMQNPAFTVSARNATTGVANWTQSYVGGYGYAGSGNLIVDANNRVYAGRQAFNSDGTSRWTLSSTGTPSPIIGSGNTMVYYDRVGNLYNYKPWTLSGSLDSNTHGSGEIVTITATSSMLRVDPASSSDNQVQAVMSNGDKVGLTYDSASGGNTVWKGTYIIPANTAGGTYSGALQAIAYNVTTDVTTSFNSLPTGFNNTGITATFCYGVSSSAACSPSTTSVASPDIKGAGAGGIVSQNNVVSVVPAHTFNYDAYFSVTSAPQIQAFNLPGTNYWQISPVYLLWWKSFFNDANILSSELNKPFIISLPYAISAYTPNLTLNNLKLAHSTDNKHWKVLANIIQNKNNKTIGLVTKNGGYYMIVAGSVLANQPILGAKTEDTELQLAPSPLPTVEPTSIPTLQPTPMPAPKKHCFWFICF